MDKINYLSILPRSFLPSAKKSLLPLAFLLMGTSGCTALNNMGDLNAGSDAGISPQDIAAYASNQEEVYQALLKLAALPDQPATTDEWHQFIMAGVQYSDQKCENYLDAIQWANHGRHRDSNLVGQSGTFTNNVMGIAKASARELALTAAAFGYVQSTFDAMNSERLSGLEVSSIRKLVRDMQQQYLDNLDTNQYTHRVGAFNALQGYIRLCLPGTIEAEANNAVRGAKPVSKAGGNAINKAPYVSMEAQENAVPAGMENVVPVAQ